MTKKTVLQIVLCVVFILSLVTPAVPGRAAQPQSTLLTIVDNKSIEAPASIEPMAETVNWCVAGGMNGWNNASTPLFDDGTNGDTVPGDRVYSYTMTIATASFYEWKAVECAGDWSVNYPLRNSWFSTAAADQVVTFTFDTNDYSANVGMALLPAHYIVNVTGDTFPTSFTAVGAFQGWNNENPATLMTNVGNGYYRLVYSVPMAGSYSGRVVPTSGWNGFGADGRSVDGVNISFTTTVDNQDVVFLLDSYTGRLLIEPVASGTSSWCAAGDINGWNAASLPLFDDGSHGDLVGGDGVFMSDVTLPTAGRYEWKVTNCTWDVSYPAGNSWLITTQPDQIVKLSFDTNNHGTDVGLDMVPVTKILHAWDSSSNFTVVGGFQGWNFANPVTTMTSLGYGLYRLNVPITPADAYEYKVVVTSSWDAIGNDNRSSSAANIPFTTFTPGDVVPFLLDYRTGRVGVFPPPAPTEASQDNQVWWGELGHNSRDTIYRNPGGPVTTDIPVTLRLRAAQGDLTEVKLRLYNDRTNVQTMLPMSIVYSDGTYDWWQAVVPASPDPTVFWYRFVVIDGTDTDYYEDDAARTMGWGQAFDESPDYSYQLTVYDSGFRTPDWIKNAIVYQVFPDRFRDGDSTNNKPAGTFFYNEPGGTVYRSLGTEWNTPICDPRGTDGCAGSYSQNFYGGDLQGLIDKIDYLQNLGVTAIYLNPIFESPSNHGYDTTDYMAINPMFGDAVTFNTLTAVLQARGMHLILDGVFNHVSSDSIYFDRYENFEELGACESITSPYRSWFYFTDVPAGTGPCVGSTGVVGGATYESWWGYDSLPKLNSTNPQVRALIWESDVPENTVAGHWMQFADGWRLDVGADVDPGTTGNPTNDYWEGFRKTVKTVNPEGYITGEEWGIANSWLLGGEWDAVMNYQFSSAVLSLWRDEAFTDNDHTAGSSAGFLSPLTPEQFDERILNLIERYSPEALQAMLNLFGSHDTSRALFMLDHNTDLNDPTLYANPAYDWTDAINRLKGAVAVQMTMPGAPTIYYGDEVGLVGPMAYAGGKWEDDPYNRQPFPWLDEGAGTPFYTHLQSQPSQDALRINYLGLAYARNAHPALRTGDYRTLVVDNTNNVYAYGRNLPGEDSAVVLINRATTDQTVTLDVSGYLPNGAAYGDVFSSATYIVTIGQLQNVAVSANRSLVLVLRDSSQVAPPAPVVLSAIANGTDVNLNWTASAGRYLVYRTNLYGGGYELIAAVTGDTFYTDKSLPSGQRVYYIVVVENTTTGLLSINSNEVSAIPAYIIGWANLQWPFTISHTIGITPTENIYGQVWINGVTSEPGATPGLIAQVGYGPNETDPRGNASWIWFDAAFNGQVSNNDEFVGALLPEAIGVYDYIYRYSTNGAVSWEYAYEGEGGLVFDPYNAAKAGDLTVNASSDVTPPSAPVLTIEDWSASSISLSWSPVTDDVAVYAYDLYRSTNGTTFNKIDRVLAATLTYFDTTVVTDQLYYYYVIALDTSFNPSVPSNTVSQIAEAKLVAVKFEVTVPAWTPGVVYIVGGNAAVGNWNPGAVAMTKVSDTLWTLSADILDGTAFEFKITRGNWETVMKGLDGNEELANLSLTVDYGTDGTQTYSYTVLNWRDPIVVSTVPLHETVDVALNSSIVVTWSQVMAASACPEVWVGLDPTDLVAVTCSFDSVTNEMTITPTSGFPPAAQITVGLVSLDDLGGDAQQVSAPLTFRTDYLKLFMPLVTR